MYYHIEKTVYTSAVAEVNAIKFNNNIVVLYLFYFFNRSQIWPKEVYNYKIENKKK